MKQKFLIIGPHKAGFFSLVNNVIGSIYLTENFVENYSNFYGRIPLVFWGNTLYSIYLYKNLWTEYFKQINDFNIYDVTNKSWEELNKSVNYSNCTQFQEITDKYDILYNNTYVGPPLGFGFSDVMSNNDSIKFKKLSTIAAKLKPLPFIENEVNNFYKQYIQGKNIVAIHYRGTDKIKEVTGYLKAKRKSSNVSVKDYKDFYSRAIEINADNYFLATDCGEALSFFKERMPKILFNNCLRSFDNQPIHINNQNIKLGAEVLIDCLLLSNCNYLLHSLSNIPQTALMMNNKLVGEFIA